MVYDWVVEDEYHYNGFYYCTNWLCLAVIVWIIKSLTCLQTNFRIRRC